MSAIKKISKKKLVLLLLILTMVLSGTAYAGYKVNPFTGDKQNVTSSISGVRTTVEKLTDKLTSTVNLLRSEKTNHNSDVKAANEQISSANDYASSVASALNSTTADTQAAETAISAASDAASYDPSTSSSTDK